MASRSGRQDATSKRSSPGGSPHTATRDAPGSWQQLLQRGCALHQAGRLPEAQQLYSRVLDAAPGEPNALHLSGVIDHQRGDHEQAATKIERAIAAVPTTAALNNLSSVYQSLNRGSDALAAAERAVKLDPSCVEALINLGKCEAALGHYDRAETRYRRVLQLRPGHVEASGLLAFLLETSNRVDEAWSLVAPALREHERNVLLHLVAARCERRRGDVANATARLERVVGDIPEAASDRFVLFEMGNLLDRQGDCDRAFEFFSRANALVARRRSDGGRSDGGYASNPQVAEIRALAATCRTLTPEDATQGGSDRGEAPVFVVGFPRSGNTLLDQMLDSHPQLSTRQEVPALWHVIRKIKELHGRYPEGIAHLTPKQIATLRDAYFRYHAAAGEARPDQRLVDTNPLASIHVPLIRRLFPESPLILTIRHPLDVCLSCFMHDFAMNDAMANFSELTETAAFYGEVMQLWRTYERVLELKYCLVRYEDVVRQTEREQRKVCAFLDIAWDPAMLAFDTHARQRGRIDTPSYHQVTEGIYERARFRWHRYRAQLAPIQSVLRPWVSTWGYAADAMDSDLSPNLD